MSYLMLCSNLLNDICGNNRIGNHTLTWYPWAVINPQHSRHPTIPKGYGIYLLRLGNATSNPNGSQVSININWNNVLILRTIQNSSPRLQSQFNQLPHKLTLLQQSAAPPIIYIGQTNRLQRRIRQFYNSSNAYTNFFISGNNNAFPITNHAGGKWVWKLEYNGQNCFNIAEITWIDARTLKQNIQTYLGPQPCNTTNTITNIHNELFVRFVEFSLILLFTQMVNPGGKEIFPFGNEQF